MSEAPPTVLTIGHSNHEIEAFVALLERHGVTAVADVRSVPFSRHTPQFNRSELQRSLGARGIRYVFLGRELGARSDDPACYEDGRVRYDRVAQTELFQSGLMRVRRGAAEHQVALMCAEKDPLDCHRTLLVARRLHETGTPVRHILANGGTETHEAAMERLLDRVGLPRDDLFRSREELVSEALARQEAKVAYADEAHAGEQGGAPQ